MIFPIQSRSGRLGFLNLAAHTNTSQVAKNVLIDSVLNRTQNNIALNPIYDNNNQNNMNKKKYEKNYRLKVIQGQIN